MKFSGDKAWQAALASVSASRDVLFPVAGVFFLLPSIVTTYFFSELQTQIIANMGNEAALDKLLQGKLGSLFGVGLGAFLVQLIGYAALMALMTDRQRPTVSQAIGIGIRSLPTLLGSAVLFLVAYLTLAIVLSLISGVLGVALGAQAVGVLGVLLVLAAMAYLMVKFSLTLPVVMIDGVLNPIAALKRSWQLTKGNSARIFVFYLLLTLAYVVIMVVLTIVVMGLLSIATKPGPLTLLLGGVVSGLVGAAAGVVFTAVLAAIHRQLSGDDTGNLGLTFG